MAADAQSAADRLNAFINGIKTLIPSPVSLQVLPEFEVVDETNGNLTNFLTAGATTAIAGTASSTSFYMGTTGAVLTWRTNGVRNGRRVRGRTFLVPLSGAAWDTNGTLNAGAHTTLGTAANALISTTGTPDLGVWARPSGPAASDGAWHPISGYTIPDVGTILRSRRE